MRIGNEDPRFEKFDDIEIGVPFYICRLGSFEYDKSNLYMKMTQIFVRNDNFIAGKLYNAVNLASGEVTCISEKQLVVIAKVHVEDDKI